MKKIHKLMMMYAAMGAMMPDMHGSDKDIKRELTPDEINRINSIREEKRLEIKMKSGLKEWDINGVYVVALNKNNAIRKANNIIKVLIECQQ